MTLGRCSNHVGRLWLKLVERREELGLRRRSPKNCDRSAEIFAATARPTGSPCQQPLVGCFLLDLSNPKY